MVRVRMAPSPTGYFHIGGARTAIFNWLFARNQGGKFILRIEDTDEARSKKEFEEDVLESLRWLGVQWDEGPFRQSERTQYYVKHLQQLLDQDKAYHCFCSKEQLDKDRADQEKKKLPPRYSGRCASLSTKEQEARLANGETSVIRFRLPSGATMEFTDAVRGHVCFASKEFDDFVIAKSLHSPLYNFTAVVDDYLMKISHVIRGEDHLTNTAKQILLYQALGFPMPQFAHLPLIVDAKRAKLSKREGGVTVRDFRAQGFLPEALANYLVLLGWHSRDDKKEIFSLAEIADEFSLDRIQKSSATWDEQKLLWLNGQYLRGLSGTALQERALPYLVNAGFLSQEDDGTLQDRTTGNVLDAKHLAKACELIKERIKLLSEAPELLAFVFAPAYDASLLVWKKETKTNTKAYLAKAKEILHAVPDDSWTEEVLHGEFIKYLDEQKIGRSNFLWPLRVAISSRANSPGTFELLAFLGKHESIARTQQALDKLG